MHHSLPLLLQSGTRPRKILIARHGERLDHCNKKWREEMPEYANFDLRDSPLSPLGVAQADELGRKLKVSRSGQPSQPGARLLLLLPQRRQWE